MKKQLIESEYNGISLHFSEDAWFNATEAAAKFGKAPYDWLRLPATEKYLDAFERKYGKIPYLTKKRGVNGGTWLHPKLAVRFAQWLDDDFAVWCDEQIDQLIRGDHPHYDWKRARHEASASHKVMADVLKVTREIQGKETKAHHYSNEARLINFALTGKYQKVDRTQLSKSDLDLIAKLETRDAAMIGQGFDYEKRKEELGKFVKKWREDNAPTLTQIK